MTILTKQQQSDLAERLNRPLRIGNHTLKKRLVPSPMTGLGHIAFRELLSDLGGFGCLFTEMCSAGSIPKENRHISPYFRWRDEEKRHLVCQILGNHPDTMAAAARRIEDEGLFGVDINFGCCTSLISQKNNGAALLKTPQLAVDIVAAVRKAISIPLFIKFRTGWCDNPKKAVDMAKGFEEAGADALTYHPRVAPDRRTRPPRWDYIGKVKSAVSIPVFGNGDVFDRNDCLRMLQATGCNGVAIGRMGIARPWLFAEWTEGLKPEKDIALNSALRLIRLLGKHFDPNRALRRFRRFAPYFSATFKFGHTLCSRLVNVPDVNAAEKILTDFFQTPPECRARPNANLFL